MSSKRGIGRPMNGPRALSLFPRIPLPGLPAAFVGRSLSKPARPCQSVAPEWLPGAARFGYSGANDKSAEGVPMHLPRKILLVCFAMAAAAGAGHAQEVTIKV